MRLRILCSSDAIDFNSFRMTEWNSEEWINLWALPRASFSIPVLHDTIYNSSSFVAGALYEAFATVDEEPHC